MAVTESEASLPATVSDAIPATPDRTWIPSRVAVRVSRKTLWRILLAVVIIGTVPAYLVGKRWFTPAAVQDIQLYAVARKSFPIILTVSGELKAAKSMEVRSELEGRATIISLIAEGTHVKQGDLLVELASDEIDERIRDLRIKESVAESAYQSAERELQILRDKNQSEERKAQLALEMARLGLDKYRKGEARELRKESEIAVKQAEQTLQRAKDYLRDSEELFKEGFITRIERDRDEFEAWKAENELEKARVKAEVLETYTIPMELQKKQSDVVEAEAELERTKNASKASEEKTVADVNAKKEELAIIRDKLAKAIEQKNKARILAPGDGLVVYYKEDWWDETRIKTGAEVHERQPIVELPDTSSMKVVVRVHEALIERLKEGLPATVTLEGYSGRQYPGKISKIGMVADSQHRWINPNMKEYVTEVLIDGNTSDLKPGGTAKVDIQVTQLSEVLAVPVQAVFGKSGKYFVFVDEGREIRPVEVEIGLSSTEFIEIKKGLETGQKVRLVITEDMKRMLPEGDEKEGRGEAGRRERKAISTSKPAAN